MKQQPRSQKAQKLIERMAKKLNRQMVGSLTACVHCGLCLPYCPTYRALGLEAEDYETGQVNVDELFSGHSALDVSLEIIDQFCQS